jgi:hypothetical protein
MSLKIITTGRIDERESAFPQAVQLPDGDSMFTEAQTGHVRPTEVVPGTLRVNCWPGRLIRHRPMR